MFLSCRESQPNITAQSYEVDTFFKETTLLLNTGKKILLIEFLVPPHLMPYVKGRNERPSATPDSRNRMREKCPHSLRMAGTKGVTNRRPMCPILLFVLEMGQLRGMETLACDQPYVEQRRASAYPYINRQTGMAPAQFEISRGSSALFW